MKNALYFGDCLDVLREFGAESVDLIYLDPPFNSKADYNVLFNSPTGDRSKSQIEAFEDTWHWCEQSEQEFSHILRQANTDVAELIIALRRFLGENDILAYLVMMASRLLEMHRLLKSTGSLYLHCDPTASHYLKILLDAIFGAIRFKNEVIWQRTNSKGHAYTRLPSAHDTILVYEKDKTKTWNPIHLPHSESYKKSHYSRVEAGTGRHYRLDNCLNPNPDRPNLTYEWNGHLRVWRWTKDKMQELHNTGRLVYSTSGMPQYKRYLDEMKGTPVTDVWTDIPPINSQAKERLGYPTQKPLALLERIISVSSNEGDMVLDPFCGCGTAVHAAHKLNRRWIGIDITHLAVSLIEKRLRDAFPGINFDTFGTPKDVDGARDLALRDKYQFQWWACSLINAQPYQGKKKGADGGIDGIIYFQDDIKNQPKKIIVSVKGGQNVGVPMIRDLAAVMEREKAEIGLFVTLEEPTKPMRTEAVARGLYTCPHNGIQYPKIQILTVKGLLEGTEKPAYTDLQSGDLTLKRAVRTKITTPQHKLL